MTAEPGVPTAVRTFAGRTSSIGEARRFVRDAVAAVVAEPGCRGELGGDLELSVSELVTNAVEYAPDQAVTVMVDISEPTVVISVRSARTSSGIADPSTWAGPLPAMRTGRGLAIVRSVSDDVSVDVDEATVTVSCAFRVG